VTTAGRLLKAKCIRLHAGYNVGEGYLAALSFYFSHQQQLALTNYCLPSSQKRCHNVLYLILDVSIHKTLPETKAFLCVQTNTTKGTRNTTKLCRVFDTRRTCHRTDRLGLMAFPSVSPWNMAKSLPCVLSVYSVLAEKCEARAPVCIFNHVGHVS
jgi:hypothetical protein